MFDESFWEERYSSHPAVWSRSPNPQLVSEAADLPIGSALDVGSGEGADALWLADRGWQVTAVDFSATALRRGAEHADALGADVADRIQWVHADLTAWAPPDDGFDLVSAQYMQLPPADRDPLFAGLASTVRAGGTLLIVGHHPSDLASGAHRPPSPDMFYTAEEIADSLSPNRWEILAVDNRPRTTTDPEGQEINIQDAVLRARKTVAPGSR